MTHDLNQLLEIHIPRYSVDTDFTQSSQFNFFYTVNLHTIMHDCCLIARLIYSYYSME